MTWFDKITQQKKLAARRVFTIIQTFTDCIKNEWEYHLRNLKEALSKTLRPNWTHAEGFILGVGAKMFTIAGPVIVYGVSASVVYGLVYWITTLF